MKAKPLGGIPPNDVGSLRLEGGKGAMDAAFRGQVLLDRPRSRLVWNPRQTLQHSTGGHCEKAICFLHLLICQRSTSRH